MQQPMKQKDEEFGEWSHQHYGISKGKQIGNWFDGKWKTY